MNKKTVLVLSGGSVKGIAHIGALQALKELNILQDITIFSGSSVGSLIVTLCVLGYSPNELYDFIMLFEFDKMKCISINNIRNYGLDSGEKLEIVIKNFIKAKGLNENITFNELYKISNKKIIMSTVCVNKKKTVYLSHESHPDLPIYLGLKMSMAIPFYFTPIKYNGMYYIDGACIDNLPIHLFNDKINEVIAINIVEKPCDVENIDNIEIYTQAVLSCLMTGMNINCKKGYEDNIIDIDLDYINVLEFNINNDLKKKIFQSGFDIILKKLS